MQRGYKLGFHRTYWGASSLETYYEYYKDDYDSVFDFTSWVYDDTQDILFKKFQYFIERDVDPLFIIKTLNSFCLNLALFPSTPQKLSLPPLDRARRCDSDAPIESSVAQI